MEDLRKPDLTSQVIGLAIEVHRHLGPGLLESAYEECLCHELRQAKIAFVRQQKLPVRYKAIELNARCTMDIVIEDSLVVEVKAVDPTNPIHKAQLLTYLRLGGYQLGLLLNFNRPSLKDGITRMRL
ncbi:GxxExxY protein [Rhodopila sp.]|uniref:GxxExxY protein n=1 Tax=Rhodopila sp. TaxID=2480087 RepID=UPI003D135301